MARFYLPAFLLILFFSLSAQTPGEWVKKNSFPKGIMEKSVAFAIGGKGYAGLGTDNVNFRKDFWQYDPKEDNWNMMEKFPGEPRICAAAFSVGNKGYVGTGLTGKQNLTQTTNDFWEFDPKKESWTQKANFPGESRSNAVGFCVGLKGYIGLGTGKGATYSDMWEYDPRLNKWNKKADLPEGGRTDACAFVIGSAAYIVAGQGKEIIPTQKDAWKFDPIMDEWKKIAPFPGSPRVGALGFSYRKKGYITGGFKALKHFDDLWEYDSPTDTWNQKKNVPYGNREYIFSFVTGNSVYICTGYGEKKSSGFDIWQYSFANEKAPDKFAIGGSLLLGDNRVPLAAATIKILNDKNETVSTAATGLFGSFLFMELPNNQEYTLSLEVSDPHWRKQKIYLVNRENETIATLEPENDFKFRIAIQEKSKLQLLKIENKNMRMDMRGKLALNGDKKVPFPDAEISLINEQEEVVQVTTTDKDGHFVFSYLPVDTNLYLTIDEKATASLPKGTTILLMDENETVINKSTASNSQMLLINLPPEQNKLRTIYVEDPWLQAASGTAMDLLVIENIYFDVAKWELLPEARAVLNKIVILMKSNKKINVEISAHTDSRGDAKSNLELSEKRAQEAKKYIVSQGGESKKIRAKGFGESMLINKCSDGVECTEEEHARNRRMEFKIIYTK